MKKLLSTRLKVCFVTVTLLALLVPVQLMAKPDWIGNIIANNPPANFTTYWNQVTSENAGKWQSVEGTRGSFNWSAVDNHYNWAKQKGFPYKFHTLVWGSQEPSWVSGLSTADQRTEITDWIKAVGQRYKPDMIDVVNEPLHAPSNCRNGLGGSGSTGWDWVIESFRLARENFDCKLLINEYGIISDPNATNQYLQIINLLVDRGLVDGIGIQCHQFNVDNVSASTITSNLNKLAATGLPIYVSELDVTGDDYTQRQRYENIWLAFYNHPAVKGITFWGYIQGQTWKDNTHLVSSGNVGASERPAMQYLKPYLLPIAGSPTPTPQPTPVVTGNILIRAAGSKGGEIIKAEVNGVTVGTWTLKAGFQSLVANGNGGVRVYFTNDDEVSDGLDVQIDYIEYNGQVYEAEDQEINTGAWQDDSCGGSYDEWLYCSGYIQFNTEGSVTPTPAIGPTPTIPAGGAGEVFFGKSSYSAKTNSPVNVDIYVNTGSQTIGAYGLVVTYSTSILAVDTSKGTQGVSPGTNGFVSAAKDQGGSLNVGGFDAYGKGPGEDLHLITIHFMAQNQGSGTISLTVNELIDSDYKPIGVPRGDSASVSVSPNGGLLGDVDGNDVVNIVDALMVAQFYVGLNPSPFDESVADVDCNETVNIVDALQIAQYYVGLLTTLSCD